MNKITSAGLITFFILTLVGCNKDAANSIELKDWQLYENKEFGFSLKLPSEDSSPKVDVKKKQVEFKSGGKTFEIKLTEGKKISLAELESHGYWELPFSSKITLGGKEGLFLEAPDGVCEEADCSEPFIMYTAKNGDFFYKLTFFGDTTLSDIEKEILESFKFLDPAVENS